MFENQSPEACEATVALLNRIIASIEQNKTEDYAADQPWYQLGLEHAIGTIRMHAEIAWLNLDTPESGDAAVDMTATNAAIEALRAKLAGETR